MKFIDLLTIVHDAEAAYAAAKVALAAAEAAFEKAAEEEHAAAEAEKAAHAAIVERLAEKGHHTLVASDGTISVYQVNADVEQGWSSYHPIPGDSA